MLSSLFGVGWQKRPCDGWSEEARIEEARKRKTHPCMNQTRKDGAPALSGTQQIHAKQIGEHNEGRNCSLPDVTEQQSKGHESREPHQESPEYGSRPYAGKDWSVRCGRGWREDC